MNATSRVPSLVSGIVLVIAVGALPLFIDDYNSGLAATALIYAILAVSLDLVWGFTGVIDLGHTIWFGIGAVAVGVLTTDLDPTTHLVTKVDTAFAHYPLGMAVGSVITAVIAGLIAWWVFSFRTGGQLYVVVVTLAATVVAGIVYLKSPGLTGGDNGLFGFGYREVSNRSLYWICGGVLLAILLAATALVRSDYGIAMKAVRDNEERAGYLGVNAVAVKTFVFVLGAVVATIAGGLYAAVNGVVSEPLFGFVFATEVLIWVAIGGRGTLVGPALAAFGMGLLTSQLNVNYGAQWLLVQGVLFVLVVVFIPDGILPALLRLARRLIGLPAAEPPPRQLAPATVSTLTPGGASIPIAVDDLFVSYGSLKVLRGVNLSILRQELLAIVGPNGAGKSTLLNVIADGRISATGDITFDGQGGPRHHRRPPFRLVRQGLARKFQLPALFPSLTPAETFVLATHRGQHLSMWRRTTTIPVSLEVHEILDASGTLGHENRHNATLAHGLKQGMEIALAVAMQPEVLLLDEPTAGLTAVERTAIGEVLRELATRGVAVVLIEHDLDFVDAVANRVAVLHDGKVIHSGTPQTVRESETVRTAYVGVHE